MLRQLRVAIPALRRMAGYGLLLLLSLAAAITAVLLHDRDARYRYGAEQANALAHGAERELRRDLEYIRRGLEGLAVDASDLQRTAPERAAELVAHRIAGIEQRNPQLRDVRLVSSPPGSPGLAPAQPRRARASPLRVGHPLRRTDGEWVLPLALPIPAMGSGEEIWVAASLRISALERVTANLDLGRDGVANIMHRDGFMVVRTRDQSKWVGAPLQQTDLFARQIPRADVAVFDLPSPLDRIDRIAAYRVLPDYPLVVVVGIARQSTLEGWGRFATTVGVLGGLLALLWLALLWVLLRARAEQQALVHSLQETAEQLGETQRIAGIGEWCWDIGMGTMAWGKQNYAIFGKDPASYHPSPETVFDLLHPDDAPRLRAMADDLVQHGGSRETQFRIVRADGEVRNVRARGESARGEHGGAILRGIVQDITELEQVRLELVRSQDEYRYLFDNNPAPLWVFDRETLRFLAVNDAMLRLYGYTREEVLQLSTLDVCAPEEREIVRAAVELEAAERPQGHIWSHVSRDGRRVRAAIFSHDIVFEGRDARLVLAQDVTEREYTEERFRIVARVSNDAIYDWDVADGTLWWSESFYALFGHDPATLPATIEAWEALLHPDDLQRIVDSLQRGLESSEDVWEEEYRFRRSDGEYATVVDRGYFVRDTAGTAIRMVGGMLDITRREQDAADLRLLRRAMESTQSGILITDVRQPDMPAVYVNRGFEEMTGYPAEEILGRDARFIGFDQRDVEVARSVRRGLKEHAEMRVMLRNVRRDGSVFWNDFYMAPVRDERGQVTHMVGVSTDVTDRHRSEERFRLVTRATSDAIWDWDIATGITWRSDNVNALFGYAPGEIGSNLTGWAELLHPKDRERVLASVQAGLESDASEWEAEYCFLRKDGSYAEVLDRGFIQRDEHGRAIRAVGGMLDITERRRREADLRLLRRAVEVTNNGILICDARDPALPLVYVNRAFEEITGYAAAEAVGRNCRFLQGGDRDQGALGPLRTAIAEQREVRVQLRNYRRDGSLFWNDLFIAPVRDEADTLTHLVGVINDITEHRHAQERLAHQATHDELTGLPNRQLLQDRLQQAVVQAERYGRLFAVLFIDLDDFKLINDSLGHSAGDQALREVARRLDAVVRRTDTVARFGGDEFVAVVTFEPTDATGLEHVLLRIEAALAEPVDIGGNAHYLTASIGHCRYPDAGRDAEALLMHADMSMYKAKQQGRNRAVGYLPEFDTGVNERVHLVAELREALRQEQFVLDYQPIFTAAGEIVALEALVRWEHPVRGLLAPGAFISACEESGLIVPLGRWVLQQAARAHVQLRGLGLQLRIAVNASPVQFEHDICADVEAAIRGNGLQPGALEIEITESLLLSNPDAAIEAIRRVHELGVSVAVDDFGTGYSSLTYLQQLKLDRLKIDRSFVRDLGEENGTQGRAICAAIIQLAQTLGLETVAEGVETPAQRDWLLAHGCNELQGYLLGRPIALEALIAQLTGGPAVQA